MRDGSESPRHARSASPRRDHARSNKSPSPRRRSRSPSPLPRSRSPRRRSGSGEREPAWRARLEGILAGTVGAIVLEPSSVYEELAALSAADASAVLDRFAESNLAGVKNPGSFLQGIVRRVAAEGSADLTTCLGSLPRPLRNSFARLMEEGRLRKGDVESRVATQLRDMPLELAQAAVDRYAASRLESIRSKTGFFIGIIKRVKEEASRGPPAYGAPPPYGAPHAFGGPPPPFGAPPYGGYGGPPPHGYGGPPAPHWYGYPPYEQRGREYDRDRDRDYDRGRDRDYGRGRDRDREYDRGRSDRDRR